MAAAKFLLGMTYNIFNQLDRVLKRFIHEIVPNIANSNFVTDHL
jgi:hypothetical protein